MEFLELAASRYSVRRFSGEKVPQETIQNILKAAHLAPTGCNNQPQKIYVLQSDEALEALKDCTPYHFHAPLAFLICYDREKCWKRPFDGADSGTADACIATTHMMLQAWTEGVGSTWVMMFDPEKVRKAYNLPENLEPVALMPMGYPASHDHPSRLHGQFIPFEQMWEMK